jgi:hypothetical protein
MNSRKQSGGKPRGQRVGDLGSRDRESAAYAEVSQDADEAAVRTFMGAPSSQTSQFAYEEVQEDAGEAAGQPLALGADGSPEPGLTGNGFSYRHDFGRRRGQHVLRLNWGVVTSRSRVLVSVGEGAAGGPDNGKFVGSARYTVHNVAPRAGGVDVWVNIEWGADISIYVDYLVVNP